MTVATQPQIERPPVDETFGRMPAAEAVERAAEGLRRRHFSVHVVAGADAARELVMSLIPDGAAVGQGASQTLEEIGVTAALDDDRYFAIRPRTRKMDRATQGDEIRKMTAAPDVQVNSIHALTEDGEMLVASNTGSQLGPIASGAGKVILVVGAQKIVPDLETGFRRLREYNLPIEDAKFQATYGRRSAINKLLVLTGDFPAGRTTVVIVRQPVGV